MSRVNHLQFPNYDTDPDPNPNMTQTLTATVPQACQETHCGRVGSGVCLPPAAVSELEGLYSILVLSIRVRVRVSG